MRSRLSGSDAGIVALSVVLAVLTGLVVALPTVALVVVDERLDLVINTLATFAASAVAALAYGRFREARQTEALYQAAAFGLLATTNLLVLLVVLLGLDDVAGMALTAPTEVPIYFHVLGRLAAAALLLTSAVAAAHGWDPDRQPTLLVMVTPVAGAVVLGTALALLEPLLPSLFGVEAIERIRTEPAVTTALPGTGLLLVTQMLIGALYLGAAYRYLRLRPTARQASTPYLGVGLVIAAFSQLHFAFHPGAYASLVTTGDLLRVAFYVVLLIGVDVERRADLRAVRRANEELRRLHDAEMATAALEERARLAREVHDGLAQDLWYAKLKQARLLASDLQKEARDLAGEVATAIDAALAEARQAVMTMRPQATDGSFRELVARYVEDFGDRFGIRAEFSADERLPSLSARAQAELLRILQEALNNVRKHADATVVRVQIENGAGGVRLGVIDNGRGFEPATVPDSRYGLQSMRERAELIRASVSIDSAPHDGTRVWVNVPTNGMDR